MAALTLGDRVNNQNWVTLFKWIRNQQPLNRREMVLRDPPTGLASQWLKKADIFRRYNYVKNARHVGP